MTEKWESAIDKKASFATFRTYLSIAFGYLPHEILLARLHAYRFSMAALRLIDRYLVNRKKKTKINSLNSSLKVILFGASQVFHHGTS